RQHASGRRRRAARRDARRAAVSRRSAARTRQRTRCARHTIASRAAAVIVITYRDLSTLEEFAEVVDLERRIWGPGYTDVVPTPSGRFASRTSSGESARRTRW